MGKPKGSSPVLTWIKANQQQYTDLRSLVKACANATGLNRDHVRKVVKTMSVRLGKVATAPADSPAAPVRGGIAIQEFLDQLDVPKQILQYLTKNVRDRVLSEADLMIELRVNPTAFRRAVMNPSFDPYRLKVKDKVFWSIPANIEKAKRLINQ